MGSVGAQRNSTGNSTSGGYRPGMSKEERKTWLEEAPVGTKITGFVSNRTGNPVTIEKVTAYRTIYGGVGAGSKVQETYWEINGSKEPYMASTLRTAEEGTNKYYRYSR